MIDEKFKIKNFLYILFLFLPLLEFFAYTSKIFYIISLLLIVISVIDFFKKNKISSIVLFYSLISVTFICALLIRSDSFNNLLLIPIYSYLCYSFLKNRCDVKMLFFYFLKVITISILIFTAIELLVKLNFINFSLYKNFILNYGDQRIDVLRTRVLWGSSLSSASFGIFLGYYFSLIQKDNRYLFLVFIFIVFTGSRTAIILFLFCVFFSNLKNKKFWTGVINIKKLVLVVLCFLGLWWIAINYFDKSILNIVERAFTISADASFVGRSNTTGETFSTLIEQLPYSLLWGVDGNWLSDSAYMSIAAQSGISLLVLFYSFLLWLNFNSCTTFFAKISFLVISFLGGLVIGDFFIPSVTFLYALTFLIYNRKSL